MINDKEKSIIAEIAKKYQAKRILLFGSSADPKMHGRDIDLAVEGVQPESFFNFYADLIFSLSSPVDLIDLSTPGKFNRIIQKEGVLIYG